MDKETIALWLAAPSAVASIIAIFQAFASKRNIKKYKNDTDVIVTAAISKNPTVNYDNCIFYGDALSTAAIEEEFNKEK